VAAADAYDAEREERAEERARELLRSCVNAEEWATYEAHGLIRVYGQADRRPTAGQGSGAAPYAYLIYPHKPFGSERLPASDDVLAKWLALTSDERGLIATANVHPVGRQTDPERVRRDLERLEIGRSGGGGSVSGP
jgi:hypothetical protein